MIYQCQIRSDLLEGLGIEVTISRLTTDRNGPLVSPIPPAEQNHEGTCQKSTGEYVRYRRYHIPADKIPPVENIQDHAQKSDIGDTGGNGGILDTFCGGSDGRPTTAAQQ